MSVLKDLRPVYVVGVGMHPYQFVSQTPYIAMGLTAVRAALADAGVPFEAVESAYVGTTGVGMAAGRVMFKHLGATGLAVTQVENASASGSSALQMALMNVASGLVEVSLAVGVDKYGDQKRAVLKENVGRLSDTAHIPLVRYGLITETLKAQKGLTAEDLASVAAKNHTNASKNPFAQFRKPRTVADVLGATKVMGDITSLMCCPRGEGAAALIVASEQAIARLGVPGDKPIRVLSSTLRSETLPEGREATSISAARKVAHRTYEEAGIAPRDLDIVELHDAFAIEEIVYTEAFGLTPQGTGHEFVREGASAIGGVCAVNPSGGLIGQGHPLGPTGIGQVHEIVQQLRGTAGPRQHAGARTGMAHMIGLGTVAIAHVLQRD